MNTAVFIKFVNFIIVDANFIIERSTRSIREKFHYCYIIAVA